MVNKVCACFLCWWAKWIAVVGLPLPHTRKQFQSIERLFCIVMCRTNIYKHLVLLTYGTWPFIDEIPTIAQAQTHNNIKTIWTVHTEKEYEEKNSHWLSDWLNYDKNERMNQMYGGGVCVSILCVTRTHFQTDNSDQMRRKRGRRINGKKGETNEQFDTFCDNNQQKNIACLQCFPSLYLYQARSHLKFKNCEQNTITNTHLSQKHTRSLTHFYVHYIGHVQFVSKRICSALSFIFFTFQFQLGQQLLHHLGELCLCVSSQLWMYVK